MPSPMNYAEKIQLLNHITTSDGFGGVNTEYSVDVIVDAFISLGDSNRIGSSRGREAEQIAAIDVFTVIVDRVVNIEFDDYFVRVRDGQVFRVTSSPNEREIPDIATFQVKAFTAEKSNLAGVMK